MYCLLGFLHRKELAVTDAFVENVVKKGMKVKRPKNGTIDYRFFRKCCNASENVIPSPINCIAGRMGSWVMWGPMNHGLYDKIRQDDKLLEVQRSLAVYSPCGGSVLIICVLVDAEGRRIAIEYSEAAEHKVQEKRDTENESPYIQSSLLKYFSVKR